MKSLLLSIGIFVSTFLNAQFNMYAKAGGNYADLRVTRGQGVQDGKGGFGWQFGGGVEYHTQFGYFLYFGAGLNRETFKKDSTSQGFHNVVTNYIYKPYFLDIPLGIGYQFDLNKSVGLRIYGGITPQVGLGGKLNRDANYYIKDSVSGAPVQVRTDNTTHNLKFGNGNRKDFKFDLANTNWGFNIGAGIDIMHSAEIGASYQLGLTNILPGKDGATEVNKLSFFEVNLKVYFPNQYGDSRKH